MTGWLLAGTLSVAHTNAESPSTHTHTVHTLETVLNTQFPPPSAGPYYYHLPLVYIYLLNKPNSPTPESPNSQVSIWDVDAGVELVSLTAAIESHPLSCAFSADGSKLAVTESNGSVMVWNTVVGCQWYQIPGAHRGKVRTFSSVRGTLLYVAHDCCATVWYWCCSAVGLASSDSSHCLPRLQRLL